MYICIVKLHLLANQYHLFITNYSKYIFFFRSFLLFCIFSFPNKLEGTTDLLRTATLPPYAVHLSSFVAMTSSKDIFTCIGSSILLSFQIALATVTCGSIKFHESGSLTPNKPLVPVVKRFQRPAPVEVRAQAIPSYL